MMIKQIFIGCMVLLLACMPMTVGAELADGTTSSTNTLAVERTEELQSNESSEPDTTTMDYYDFLASYSEAKRPIVSLDATLCTLADTTGVEYGATVEGKDDVVLLKDNGSAACYTVNVETSGLYAIRLEYILRMENTLNAQFSLLINGDFQSKSSKLLNFPRRFKNATAIEQDSMGNDVRQGKVEIKQWESWLIDHPDVETGGAMLVCLKQGMNTVEIQTELGGVALGNLEICNAEEMVSYTEYLQNTNSLPDNAPEEYYWVKQAENCGDTSDSVLYPTYDRSSVDTQPNDPAKLKLNTIGQSTWNSPGQWIEWEIEIPADGYYEIGMRVRQSELRGFFSTRIVSIDGNVVFDELNNMQFPYNLNWTVKTLGDDEPYLFYLTVGTHTLRMEAALGTVAESITELENLTLEMNTLYRNTIMVTGLSIDVYRDYMLEDQVPNLIERLTDMRDRLELQMNTLASLGVKDGSDAVVIEKLIYQLDSFIDNPKSIPERLDDFLSNISSMSAWALSMKNQPLEIDYIYVKSPSVTEPAANTGMLTQFAFRAKALLSSFVEDYSSLSDTDSDTGTDDSISVWLALGRDQGQIIKDLSENDFTPSTGIPVDISLVQTGVNEAIAAGCAPDVVLFTGDVVNLASRETLADISQYENFNEMASRFSKNALTPFTYNGGVYGVPLEQNIMMLFYRTDIFAELGLKVPTTWGEFDNVLTILQQSRLTVGLFAGSSTAGDTSIFELLLYQKGGSLFQSDLSAATLDSEECYESFKQWTDYYVKYGLLTEFNFYNRFRSGEMPMGIQSQGMYATLKLAAPELDGLWEMVPVPQTVREDGSVSDVTIGSVSPAIVLKNDNEEACFRYLDWFTSTKTQVAYGQEVENILGMGARYSSANLEAVSKLNWTAEESKLLISQIKKVYITPAIPASYYVGRNLTNAFRKVVIKGYTPRESLLMYNDIINSEITRKNNELTRRTANAQ